MTPLLSFLGRNKERLYNYKFLVRQRGEPVFNNKVLIGLVIVLILLLTYEVGKTELLTARLQDSTINLEETELALSHTNLALVEATDTLSQERTKILTPRELRNFASIEELELFLAEDNTNEHEYISSEFDCDDFALTLQHNALEKGYIMNCQTLFTAHVLNMVIIDNEIYYVEPMTDEIVFLTHADREG
ncbi:hypothetical protein ACFLVV_01025 [Chloroflexota bacterium]